MRLILLILPIILTACTNQHSEMVMEDDLKKIEALHQMDMQASRTGDTRVLRSLFSEDAVVMPPGGHWIRGSEALDESFSGREDPQSEVQVLDYRLEFEEVKIMGDYAFEWGTVSGASRSANNVIDTTSYKVMRILKKNREGEWKIHRTIWNKNPNM
jgi:uncharacterized protein (TIGR02246 family)